MHDLILGKRLTTHIPGDQAMLERSAVYGDPAAWQRTTDGRWDRAEAAGKLKGFDHARRPARRRKCVSQTFLLLSSTLLLLPTGRITHDLVDECRELSEHRRPAVGDRVKPWVSELPA